MASGTLPLATYHRAAALGEGTFGSVVIVYNDDGEGELSRVESSRVPTTRS